MLMNVPVVNSVRKHVRKFLIWKMTVPGEAEETCRQAAEECPVECIAIED